jgi:hypothetical protein
MGAEEECNDAISPEPLGELLVNDIDAVDVVGDVAVTPSAGAAVTNIIVCTRNATTSY